MPDSSGSNGLKGGPSCCEPQDFRKSYGDLFEIIHFTEQLSAQIHHIRDESAIFSTIIDAFKKSNRFTATIRSTKSFINFRRPFLLRPPNLM